MLSVALAAAVAMRVLLLLLLWHVLHVLCVLCHVMQVHTDTGAVCRLRHTEESDTWRTGPFPLSLHCVTFEFEFMTMLRPSASLKRSHHRTHPTKHQRSVNHWSRGSGSGHSSGAKNSDTFLFRSLLLYPYCTCSAAGGYGRTRQKFERTPRIGCPGADVDMLLVRL